MKKIERKLTRLMDYQKFQDNKKLGAIIDGCSSRETLSSAELAGVFAGCDKTDRTSLIARQSELLNKIPQDKKAKAKLDMDSIIKKGIANSLSDEVIIKQLDDYSKNITNH